MAERTIDSAGRERLARLQPETAAERERTEQVVRGLVDPELLGRCEARVDALLTGGDLADDPAWTARDQAFIAFTDQFVFSVSHVTDEQVAALLEHDTPEQVYAFVNALYVLDLTRRLDLVATEVLANAAVRADALDPLVTEVVRLRCAQVHDCRRCGSLRSVEATQQGLDEAMAEKIAVHETSDLAPALKAALRLCDAVILTPGQVDPGLRADLREHFSDEQIAELLFDVVKWSKQKMLVALRWDAAPWQGKQLIAFDDDGAPLLVDELDAAGNPRGVRSLRGTLAANVGKP